MALAFGAGFRELQPPCLCWMKARMWARGKAWLHWPQVRRSRPSSGPRTCRGGGGGRSPDEAVPSAMSVVSETGETGSSVRTRLVLPLVAKKKRNKEF